MNKSVQNHPAKDLKQLLYQIAKKRWQVSEQTCLEEKWMLIDSGNESDRCTCLLRPWRFSKTRNWNLKVTEPVHDRENDTKREKRSQNWEKKYKFSDAFPTSKRSPSRICSVCSILSASFKRENMAIEKSSSSKDKAMIQWWERSLRMSCEMLRKTKRWNDDTDKYSC